MDNLDVAVGATGGIVDERRGRDRLPVVLTVLAVALPLITALGIYLNIAGEEWDGFSGTAKFGRVLEGTATTASVAALLLAAASYLRRRPQHQVEDVSADA